MLQFYMIRRDDEMENDPKKIPINPMKFSLNGMNLACLHIDVSLVFSIPLYSVCRRFYE